LDTLSHCPEVSLSTNEEETAKNANSGKNFSKEDFTAVNRFDNHGGGWGYSGHSIEAIRFMVDTDILLGESNFPSIQNYNEMLIFTFFCQLFVYIFSCLFTISAVCLLLIAVSLLFVSCLFTISAVCFLFC